MYFGSGGQARNNGIGKGVYWRYSLLLLGGCAGCIMTLQKVSWVCHHTTTIEMRTWKTNRINSLLDILASSNKLMRCPFAAILEETASAR